MVYSLKKCRIARQQNRSLIAALVISVYWLAPWAAVSAEPQEQKNPNSERPGGFFVGGIGALPEFEGADDQREVPFVVARFETAGVGVEVEGLQTRFNVLNGEFWRAGPMLSFVLPRDEDFVDEPTVGLLEDVDFALELGGYVGFEARLGRTPEDRLRGYLALRRDVLGAHEGLSISAKLEYFFKVSRMLRFGVAVQSTWADDRYHDTYFSIDSVNASRSGLTIFDAEAGIKDVGIELYNITSFSESWGVFTRVSWNRLLGDAADSPIVTEVGSEDQIFTGIGVFYRW